MKVVFRAVPTLEISSVWKAAFAILEPALSRPGLTGLYEPEDWRERLADERIQLWVIEAEGRITTACLTQVERFPRAKVLHIVAIAGKGFDLWPKLFEDIRDWAKSIGCRFIHGAGREGWERMMKDSGLCKIGTKYLMEIKDV